MQFFELLQIAIGNRSQLSRTPTAEEWREICALAKKQAMVGIAFCGVEQLPVEQRPPRKLWMQWYTAAERIKGLNAEMDRKVFKVARMFRREGFQGVVLKGQGMAQLYKVERSTVNGQRTTDGPHPNPLQGERGLGLPDEGFDLTQKAQNNCQGQGQQTTVNGQRTDHPDETLLMDHELHGLHENSGASATISHTESTESTENFCQRADAKGASVATTRTLVLQRSAGNSPNSNLDTNTQITHTQACAGQDSQRLNDNVNDNQGTGKFSILNSQFSIKEYRTPGDIDIWLHGERDEILEYVRWHVPDCKPVYHHVDFPVVDDVSIEVHFTPTWMNSPIRNRRLQRFFKSMVNSQQSTDGLFNQRDKHTNLDASTHTQACAGHPGCSQISHTEFTEDTEFSCNAENICQRADAKGASVATTRTLVLQRSAGNSPNTNSQNLHDASPVRLPDEGFDLTQKAQNTQNISVNANIDTNLDSNSQNAHTQACAGRPDGTVDRRPLTVDNCSSTVDSNSLPVDTCLDSKQATFPVPNAAFNRVYILVHIYRHLFAEGIGLRQLLDYYFVLQQGFTESEREETLRVLRSLGMMRFTRAVMWMLQEVFGMPDCYLLTSPDAKEGRFLLDEIMLAGNFGKYDERMQRAAGEGTFRWGLRKVLRNFRFVRSYPSEVLWSPIFKVWHLFWRIRHA